MRKLAAVLLSMSLAALAAGCAEQSANSPAAAASSGRECFRAADVNGYHPRAPSSVDVQVGASRYYRLELQGTWLRRGLLGWGPPPRAGPRHGDARAGA